MSDQVRKFDVVINGKNIPVRVSADEEIVLKKIEKEINNKLISLHKNYDIEEKDRVMAMVLISYAMELEKLKAEESELSISDRLDAMSSKIVNALK